MYQTIFGFTNNHNIPMVAVLDYNYTYSWAVVQFYDCRFNFSQYGQFVSEYATDTFNTIQVGKGLQLDGGIPEWSVPAEIVQQIQNQLTSQYHVAAVQQEA